MLLGAMTGSATADAPDPGQLPRRDHVEQGGITWRFDRAAPVGQFVNGDYYVVGPVTVTVIEPAPADGRNGSVKNPAPQPANRSGFDARTPAGRYDAALAAALPIELKPGDNLVSSIGATPEQQRSRTDRKLMVFLNHVFEPHASAVWSYSILTCLAAPVPPDTFRPGYCDRQQRMPRARDLETWRLHRLAPVEGTPDIEELARIFRQPWLDIVMFNFDSAVAYQPMYARDTARSEGIATLLLNLDFPDERKWPLLINFVQYGIDLWSIVRDGGHDGWTANGGHGSGRKWPIVFAGLMLGDRAMASPTVTVPGVRFGQDMQTMYGKAWTGANVVYAGHRGVWKGQPDGKIPAQQPYEHLHPREWAVNTYHYAGRSKPTTQYEGEVYRRSINSPAWVGIALSGRLMRAEPFYAHDAFFDYVDRWMTEDDAPLREEIMRSIDTTTTAHDFREARWHAGRSHDPFVDRLWKAYRDALPPPRTPPASGGPDGGPDHRADRGAEE